jgi:hypothetical protein
MKKKIDKKTAMMIYGRRIPRLKGCDESSSSSDESSGGSDIEAELGVDETNIFNSLHRKKRASIRVKQIWAWQFLISSYMESF